MAVINLAKSQNRCIMCEGSIEKANFGNVCNSCKDKMMKR